jgi:hypothetical protein
MTMLASPQPEVLHEKKIDSRHCDPRIRGIHRPGAGALAIEAGEVDRGVSARRLGGPGGAHLRRGAHHADRQQFIVDNRGGASGSIGTQVVATSPPDGYTFGVVFDTHAVNPSLIPNLPFDTLKDLAR